MKIAIPTSNGKLCMHFGHCDQFSIIDIDSENKSIEKQQLHTPPPHEPGVLPKWLADMNVNIIIAGGMGQRAQQLFTQNNIQVITGAPSQEPQKLVTDYINGSLVTGNNICDH